MKTYRAIATREEGWWLLPVPELDIVSQAPRLHRAEATIRDLIAIWLAVPGSSFNVVIDVPEFSTEIAEVR